MPDRLEECIIRDFGSVDIFNRQFADMAVGVFGSGWVWLVEDEKGRLFVVPTKDADNPLRHHLNPLMCVDVWEHAYYLDYQNRRAEFIKEYAKLIDWDKVESRMSMK